MTNPNGRILYHGPSELDGENIVVIATGFSRSSKNTKTGGDLIQTFIMRDDVAPHIATKLGLDSSVCGDCRHRPVNDGSCYVVVHHGPRAAWQCWATGTGYAEFDAEMDGPLLAGLGLRLGSYGDPAAVPVDVWTEILGHVDFHTGYTHQWAGGEFDVFAGIVMASADSVAEREVANARGFRTFRVVPLTDVTGPAENEFSCPASAERDHVTTCDACKACGGTGSKARADVVIRAHGQRAKRFEAVA